MQRPLSHHWESQPTPDMIEKPASMCFTLLRWNMEVIMYLQSLWGLDWTEIAVVGVSRDVVIFQRSQPVSPLQTVVVKPQKEHTAVVSHDLKEKESLSAKVEYGRCSSHQLFLFKQEDGFIKELSIAMQLLRNCLYRNLKKCKVSRAPSQFWKQCWVMEQFKFHMR